MSTVKKGNKKATKKVTSKAKAASEKKAVQKIILNKELKYVYPKDIFGDKPKMKSFRNKVRKAIQKMEAGISKAASKNRKGLRADLAAYKAEVHTVEA